MCDKGWGREKEKKEVGGLIPEGYVLSALWLAV